MYISLHSVSIITAFLYVILAIISSFLFLSRTSVRLKVLAPVYIVFLIVSTLYLVWFSINRGHCPFSSTKEALIFIAWFLGVVFFAIDMKSGNRSTGPFVLSFGALLFLLGIFSPAYSLPERFHGTLFPMHVSFLLFSYVMYIMVFLFVLLYRKSLSDIKNIKTGFLFSRIPPLTALDRQITVFLGFGSLFLPVGLIVGIVWAFQENLFSMFLALKLSTVLVSWIIFTTLFFLRINKKITNRGSFLFSILGFVFTLLTFMLGRHGF
jgi:ABC-type uncharacterized transport system permease subunit